MEIENRVETVSDTNERLPIALTAPPARPSPMPTQQIKCWTPARAFAAVVAMFAAFGRPAARQTKAARETQQA